MTDAGGLTSTQTLTVNVTNVNEGPALTFEDSGDNTVTAVDVAENTAAGTVIATAAGTDPDAGDTLTYSISDPNSPFAINATTGEITIRDAAAFDFEGSAVPTSVDVTVTDAGGLTSTQTLTVNVTNVNEGPALTFEDAGDNTVTAVDVAENTAAGTVIATAAGTDPDAGDTLTYSISDPDSPFAINATTGEITIRDAAAFDFEGSAVPTSVDVTVTDAGGLTSTQTLTVNVTNVNEGPALTFEDSGDNTVTAVDVAENTAAGTVIATAAGTDPDAGDTLTYSISDPNSPFAINATTGEITIRDAAAFDFEGSAVPTSVDVTVTDAGGLTSTQTLTVNVTNVNEGPALTFEDSGDNTVTAVDVAENTAAGTVIATAAGTDPDAGDTLTYSISDPDSPFAINATTGEITIRDAAAFDFEGSAVPTSVDVTVTDAGGLTSTQTLTVNVTNVNEGPALTFEDSGDNTVTAVDVAENTAAGTVIATAAGTDPDAGDTLTYSISDPDSPFAINATTGEITIRDAAAFDFEGSAVPTSVDVTVTDAGGLTSTQTLTVNVTNVNEGPALTFEDAGDNTVTAVDVAENTAAGTVIATAAGTDPDAGDTLTYSISDPDSPFAINATTGEITIRDAAAFDFEGSAVPTSVDVTVTDAGGLTSTQTLTVNVTNVNEGPVAGDDILGQTTYTPGDTVSADTPATISNVTAVAGQWASEGVTVTAHTGNGLDPDTWQDASLSSKNVSFTEDGQSYAYSGFGVSSPGNIDGGEVDTVNGDEGSTEIVDMTFEQPMQSVTVTISALFDGVEDPNQEGDDKGPYDSGFIETARVAAYDIDGNLIGYVDVQGTPNGLVTVTLDASTLGSSTPIAEVAVMPLNDGAGHSGNNSDFLVNGVTGEAVGQVTGDYLEDHTISIDPSVLLQNDSDPDGDTLTVTAVAGATHGSVSLVNGQIVFVPEADYSGQASFTYTVSDGHGGTDTATVTLNITPVNDAPEAGEISYTMAEDGTLTINESDIVAAATDAEGDTISVTSMSVNGGSLTDNGDGTWTFQPDENWNGTLDLSYTLSDGTAHSTGTATITVTPEADPARIGGDTTGDATEDTQPTAEGQLTITDPDAGQAYFNADTLSGEGHHGTLTIDESGHWTYEADNASTAVQELGTNQTLTDSFTVTSADGTAQTISVTIHGTNDNPLATDDSFTVGQAEITDGTPVSVTLPQSGSISDVVNQWAASGIAISALHGHVTGNDGLQLSGRSADLTLDGQNGIGIAGGLNNEVDYKSDEVIKVSFDDPMTSADITLNYFYSNDSNGRSELMRVYVYDTDNELIGYVEVEASSSSGLATIHVDADALGGTTIGSLYLVPVDDGNGNGRWSDNSEFSLQSITATPAVYGGETGADLTIVNGEIHIDPATLLTNDSDIDLNDPDSSLTVTDVSNAVGGSVSLVNGEIVFEPTPGYSGTTSFTYTVSDGHGGSSSATVTLNLADTNTAPEAGDVNLTVNEDTPLVISESDILTHVTDADGDTLSVTALSVDGGALQDNGNGTWTFTPDANWNGSLNLSYTVSDGTDTVAGSGTLTVSAVNDAPVLDVDGATYTLGDAPVSIADGVTITDVDSSQLSQAVITLTNTQAGDVLNTSGVSGLDVNVTHVGDDTIITLTGDASTTVYEAAIKAITFSTTSDSDAARNITVQVTDNEGTQSEPSNLASSTISVAEHADAPMWVDEVNGQNVSVVSQNASYSNMIGIYTVDAAGNPSEPEIILYDSKNAPTEVLRVLAGDEEIHFFLIPNGATLGLDANANLHFVMNNGQWALALSSEDGTTRIVDVRFDDANFNPLGEEASFLFESGQTDGVNVDPGESTRVAVDDQTSGPGSDNTGATDPNPYAYNGPGDDDDDFNDLVIKVEGSTNGMFEGGNAGDYANGGNGRDTLFGNDGNDTLIGGHMDDSLIGGDGDDSLYGDGMFGGTGSDTLDGGAGNDLLEGGDQGDSLIGGDGDDSLYGEGRYGGSGSDTLDGGAGNDLLVGGDRADTLIGGTGDDTLYGDGESGSGSGADLLNGGEGNDLLVGGDQGDTLIGGDGDDTLYGDYAASYGSGADSLDGGAGNDLLVGGDQGDTIIGGTGDDTIYGDYSASYGSGADYIDGGAGHDLIIGGNGSDTIYGGDGNDTIHGDFDTSGWSADHIDGGAGHDLIIGGGGDDTLSGGDGNDTIYGGFENNSAWTADHIDGGAGNDLLVGGDSSDTLYGGDGNDTIYGDNLYHNGGGSNDLLVGGHGDDILIGGDGNDTLWAGNEHDGSNAGNDALWGGAGNDVLHGGDGNDILFASDGNDTVYTGEGNDTIFIDHSVLADGSDSMVVKDFDLNHDVISLDNGLHIDDIILHDGQPTQLVIGSDDGSGSLTITLENVTSSNFSEISHSVVDVDTHADSLIQMLIDADNKSDF